MYTTGLLSTFQKEYEGECIELHTFSKFASNCREISFEITKLIMLLLANVSTAIYRHLSMVNSFKLGENGYIEDHSIGT